jgi:hypothetical protein
MANYQDLFDRSFDDQLEYPPGADPYWMRVHSRVWGHEGSVIDIGCARWDWSSRFLNKKTLVGIDPAESNVPGGAILITSLVGTCAGTAFLGSGGRSVGHFEKGSKPCVVTSLYDIMEQYSPVSILKMNIEGAEYGLLPYLSHPCADQLIVSFHGPWLKVPGIGDEEIDWHDYHYHIFNYMNRFYHVIELHRPFGWVLFLARH